MNKYKLQINNIGKYAKENWADQDSDQTHNIEDFNYKMLTDTSEIHDHICDSLLAANVWSFNCNISKDDLIIYEINEDNNSATSYSYQEVWDILPKKKVFYKAELEKVNRGNVYTQLEPLIDIETNEIICMTNSGNHILAIHRDIFEEYSNKTGLDNTLELMEIPVYFLDKINNQPMGALNKYFDKDEKF